MKQNRERAAEVARLRLDVVGAANEAEARKVDGSGLHAIVLGLKQPAENGLVVGSRLREKFGKEPLIVLHGAPMPSKSTEERAALAERYNVDLWVATTLHPDGLETALWAELMRRFPPPKPPPRPVDAARTDEEPSWGELLASPASVANVKKLLTKDLSKKR
jgi:hypothetical protein